MHSNPENGDLHCMHGIGLPAGDVSRNLIHTTLSYNHQFLEEIIGPDVITFATQAHSMLILQVCGGLWTSEELSQAVYKYAQRYELINLLA
jgi:hypothetical protein